MRSEWGPTSALIYILVFDRGRVVEEGPHAELLGQDGIYRRLFTMQASGMMELV